MINLEELKLELKKNGMCSAARWTYIADVDDHYGIFHGADGELLEETDSFTEAIVLSRKISNELDYERSKDAVYLAVEPKTGFYDFYNNIALDDLKTKLSLSDPSPEIYTCLFDIKGILVKHSKTEKNHSIITSDNLIDMLIKNNMIVNCSKTDNQYPEKEYTDVEYPDELKEINILSWGKSCGLLHDSDIRNDLSFYDMFMEIKTSGYDVNKMISFLNAVDSDAVNLCKFKLDLLVNRLL